MSDKELEIKTLTQDYEKRIVIYILWSKLLGSFAKWDRGSKK